ncbi:MAG TPA: RDD family protein [Candidatus Limnocylindrales bacterium]|nr:RDD family protein [Candidatus Limnocylindrales bacterium]
MLSATPTTAAGWAQPAEDRRELAPGLVFSGTAARFVAYTIDGILVALVGGVITSTIGSGAAFDPRGGLIWTTGDFVASILTVAINGAYFIAFWSGGRRATLGQMLIKIQVGNAFDGKSLTLEQAVRRWLGLGQFLGVFAVSAAAVGLIGLLSLVWTIVLFISTVSSPTKQGLHDRFANTAVVRPANAGNGLIYTCLFVFILLPLLAVLAVVSLVIIGSQVSGILSTVGESVQP